MFDYHLHSNVSFDAYDSPARCAMAAREMGLTEICFTEHQEIDYPYEEQKSGLDYELYERELNKARACVPELVIKKGVELSLMPQSLEKIARDVKGRGFDFIIASQHTVKDKDPYFGDGFEGKTLRDVHREYLEEMLYDLEHFEDFDVIGHIGYIDKYLEKAKSLTQGGEPFRYQDFPELLDAILLSAITRGKGMEINTSNYFVYDYPTPHKTILKRFVELGGEIVTLGSDAHFSTVIGHRFEDAFEFLEECGVRYLCTYENRKPSFVPLSEARR